MFRGFQAYKAKADHSKKALHLPMPSILAAALRKEGTTAIEWKMVVSHCFSWSFKDAPGPSTMTVYIRLNVASPVRYRLPATAMYSSLDWRP